MNVPITRAHAEHLDRSDALAGFRDEFHLPQRHDGTPRVYLCGHSLGLAPRRGVRLVNEELEHWARLGVDGHFDSPRPWLSYHELLTGGLARLTGASPLEVVAMNSLTVNLHLMLATFYRPTAQRHKILIEQQAFSSDRYAVASQVAHHGFDPAIAVIAARGNDEFSVLDTDAVCDLIEREGSGISVIVLPGVQYLTGQWLDMRAIAECGRRQGCIVGFDLAHAVGNVPLQLHDWDADFAVWCGYKYLNGGPGATAGCFVHERHARSFELPRFAGWWGHDKSSRFEMPAQFRPLPGAEGWQISNPPILSTAPLIASLELFDRAGMQALRAKSVLLTGYLESLLLTQLGDVVSIVTPADRDQRGCQLSLRLRRSAEDARAIHRTLGERGFVCDWREPDVIRVAPAPMYNTFTEAWDFVEALKQALAA